MTEVSIIIVSYNTEDFVKKCLDSIFKSKLKDVEYEIILIDNASSDNTIKEIKEKFPEVKLIENRENFGFSRACNQGVKISRGKFILFLNPDTELEEKTISYMIEFMNSHKSVGASTCFVRLPSGKLDNGAHRGFPTPWSSFSYFSGLSRLFPKSKLFSGYTLGWLDLKKTHEVDSLVGAFMLVRRIAGDEAGWWDEDYFFYGEDIDFCYKLKEKGWKIYFVPDVSVLHHKGIAAGIKKHSRGISTADLQTKMIATNARFNAMRIFYRKHYKEKYPGVLSWIVLKAVDFKRSMALREIQKYENRN